MNLGQIFGTNLLMFHCWDKFGNISPQSSNIAVLSDFITEMGIK